MRQTRATVQAIAPRSMTVPPQICAPRYDPPSVWINAPPTGPPVRLANAATLKAIPILVPSMLWSSVSAARETTIRDWMPLDKKP